jgi:soluble cytochrome b562
MTADFNKALEKVSKRLSAERGQHVSKARVVLLALQQVYPECKNAILPSERGKYERELDELVARIDEMTDGGRNDPAE